jgi:hypothetical protein
MYWNILTMNVLINVKSSNNISNWQMEFNSAFKELILTKKVTFLLVLYTNTYKGNRGIAPPTLNVDTRSRWVVSFTHLPFYLRVLSPEPSVYMGCEAGWLQRRYRCFGEEKNICNLTGNQTPYCPDRSLVTIQENKTAEFTFIKHFVCKIC